MLAVYDEPYMYDPGYFEDYNESDYLDGEYESQMSANAEMEWFESTHQDQTSFEDEMYYFENIMEQEEIFYESIENDIEKRKYGKTYKS